MQTFVPMKTYRECAQVLDDVRLNKQIIECLQIYSALVLEEYGWKNHPAVKMWRGCETGLLEYAFECALEWLRRDRIRRFHRGWDKLRILAVENGHKIGLNTYPSWWGGEIHLTHQSNLLRKNSVYYSTKFPRNVPADLPYFWPTAQEAATSAA